MDQSRTQHRIISHYRKEARVPWFISDEAIWMAIRETGCLEHHERDRAVLLRDYLGPRAD